MSIGIAYNPCKNCKEMDKCSICELTYYRKGYIKSPTADVIADTVRKMHSMIKERCIDGGIYPAFVERVIAQIAKEMLEDST